MRISIETLGSRWRFASIAALAILVAGTTAWPVDAQRGGDRGERGNRQGQRGQQRGQQGFRGQGQQERGRGQGEQNQPYFRVSDLPMLSEALTLSEDQQAITRMLLETHQSAYSEASEARRKRNEDLREAVRESGNWENMRSQSARINDEWNTLQTQMNQETVTSLQSVLSSDQLDAWPIVERNFRRVRTIGRGRFSGESVDLYNLVRTAQLEAAAQEGLASILSEYSEALDQALVARDSFLETSRTRIRDAMREQEMDVARSIMSREGQMRARVRDVNVQYARNITDSLGGADGEQFNGEFRRQAYPRVYEISRMQRSFEMAVTFQDVGNDLLASIQSISEIHAFDLDGMNEQIIQTTNRYEPDQAASRMRGMAARFGGGEAEEREDPIRDRYFKRDQMDYRYRQQLEALLTQEQIDRLPAMREPRDPAEMERQRNEQRRADFLGRFDRNGDGQLDESEHELMRQQMRQDGPVRGFDGPGRRGGGGGGGRGGGGI